MAHGSDRRTFLKQGAASAVGLLTLAGCEPPDRGGAAEAGLDPSLLGAVADVVLPTELGADGRTSVVDAFTAWLAGYEPVPELMHGYGSQEIRYGPGDPAPRWASQLGALEIEARKRWGTGFAEASMERRREMVRGQLDAAELRRLGNATRVDHVAAALLAYWLATPDATNRCYGRAISPQTCRPLAASTDQPAALAGEG